MLKDLDMNTLLAQLNGLDLSESMKKINALRKGSQNENTVKEIQQTFMPQLRNQSAPKQAHMDQNLNLLLAITPFLSEKRQRKMDTYLKPLNMMFFFKQYARIKEEIK